ncbi:MAG: hypothetical protein F7B06_06755 [Opitutae bacterium]|nr:hypothetical protein [Opitutae bacterium]MBC9889539.1 hypothetical protein [Opitutae bacterium]
MVIGPPFSILPKGCLWGALGLLLAFSTVSPLTAKTLAQIKLEEIQEKQNRLMQAYREEINPSDKESLEFRLIAIHTEYAALLAKNPENPAVIAAYGLYLAQIDKGDDALRMLLKADSLDPTIPQVKNQLGNYMIEQANFQLALPYYLEAIRFAPREPLYHYQLANLLYYFREEFVQYEILSKETVEDQMFRAFKSAAELAPDNMAYQYRYAEAFYDHPFADLKEALSVWDGLFHRVQDERDKQIILLQQANCHLKLGHPEEASLLLDRVNDPYLDTNKVKLLKEIEERGFSPSQGG